MTVLPWIAFAAVGAGAFSIGWSVDVLGVPLAWQEWVAVPLLICGALGIAIGLAGVIVQILMMA